MCRRWLRPARKFASDVRPDEFAKWRDCCDRGEVVRPVAFHQVEAEQAGPIIGAFAAGPLRRFVLLVSALAPVSGHT